MQVSDPENLLQIGEVAELVSLSLRTIRHYEEVGLVQPRGRTAGGFRLYSRADVERLRLIRAMKPLEFTLQEMRQVLDARERLRIAPPEDRAAAADTVGMFAALAEQRCERLRDQLHSAETMAHLLLAEVGADHHDAG